MSFYNDRRIKVTRKPHQCQACDRTIEVGSAALYIAGMNSAYYGIWYGHFHHDCRAAEVAYNDLHDWCDGDEWARFTDMDSDERAWLAEEHPTVFARMFGERAA